MWLRRRPRNRRSRCTLVDIAPICTLPGQIWRRPYFAIIRHSFGRSRSMFVPLRAHLGRCGSNSAKRTCASAALVRPASDEVGDSGQNLADLGRARPKFGRFRSKFVQLQAIRPTLDRIRLNSSQGWNISGHTFASDWTVDLPPTLFARASFRNADQRGVERSAQTDAESPGSGSSAPAECGCQKGSNPGSSVF